MAQLISGFELPEGASITELDWWPSFAEWYLREYGLIASPENQICKEICEAWIAGAYWQAERTIEARTN